MPNIPNRINERISASNKEIRIALNHEGKMRPRNLSVRGAMTTRKSNKPQNAKNNDSIISHMDIRPGQDYLQHSTTNRPHGVKAVAKSSELNTIPMKWPLTLRFVLSNSGPLKSTDTFILLRLLEHLIVYRKLTSLRLFLALKPGVVSGR